MIKQQASSTKLKQQERQAPNSEHQNASVKRPVLTEQPQTWPQKKQHSLPTNLHAELAPSYSQKNFILNFHFRNLWKVGICMIIFITKKI